MSQTSDDSQPATSSLTARQYRVTAERLVVYEGVVEAVSPDKAMLAFAGKVHAVPLELLPIDGVNIELADDIRVHVWGQCRRDHH